MRFLGIDYGEKQIGLALGDSIGRIATPYKLVVNNATLFDQLSSVLQEEGIEKVIVGIPVQKEGHVNQKQLQRIYAFVTRLRTELGIETDMVDESYTTAEAQRLQEEYGATASDDELAAMLLLQAYLEEKLR